MLNGKFDDQIDEYIIIDSRYPYEYEGGHITQALNIYKKDELIEEFFIKRLNFKQIRKKITSSMSSSCLSTYLNQQNVKLVQRKSIADIQEQQENESMDHDGGQQQQQASSTNAGQQTLDSGKRVIIIFHCEFSSERGPTLYEPLFYISSFFFIIFNFLKCFSLSLFVCRLKFLRNQDRILNENFYPHLFYPELYLLEGGYKSFYETFKNYCEPQTYKPMLHSEHVDDYKHFRAKAKSWEVSRHHFVLKCNEHIQKQLQSSASQHVENQENELNESELNNDSSLIVDQQQSRML